MRETPSRRGHDDGYKTAWEVLMSDVMCETPDDAFRALGAFLDFIPKPNPPYEMKGEASRYEVGYVKGVSHAHREYFRCV